VKSEDTNWARQYWIYDVGFWIIKRVYDRLRLTKKELIDVEY